MRFVLKRLGYEILIFDAALHQIVARYWHWQQRDAELHAKHLNKK